MTTTKSGLEIEILEVPKHKAEIKRRINGKTAYTFNCFHVRCSPLFSLCLFLQGLDQTSNRSLVGWQTMREISLSNTGYHMINNPIATKRKIYLLNYHIQSWFATLIPMNLHKGLQEDSFSALMSTTPVVHNKILLSLPDNGWNVQQAKAEATHHEPSTTSVSFAIQLQF